MPDTLSSNTQHIVSAFDNELKDVVENILSMSEKVLAMLEFSRRALDNPSDEIVQDARKLDKEINKIDFDLQQKATRIIALRQPLGVDLRFVIATLKIASSLERMGDLAKSSCKKSSKFSSKVSIEVTNDLKEMNALATKMLNGVISAFRDMNTDKANLVLDQDDEVDNTYHKLLRDVQMHVESHPDAIPAFADIIFTAKNLERIGDHCTKLADLILYIASGEITTKSTKKAAKEKNKQLQQ
jgi:phosphate transport system protein